MKIIKQSRVFEFRLYHAYNYYSGSGDCNQVCGELNGYETIIGLSSIVLQKYQNNITFGLSYHVNLKDELLLNRYFL